MPHISEWMLPFCSIKNPKCTFVDGPIFTVHCTFSRNRFSSVTSIWIVAGLGCERWARLTMTLFVHECNVVIHFAYFSHPWHVTVHLDVTLLIPFLQTLLRTVKVGFTTKGMFRIFNITKRYKTGAFVNISHCVHFQSCTFLIIRSV